MSLSLVKKGVAYGISEAEVHAAMDKLYQRLGYRPSIRAIRAETGTGSDTTISRYAKTWTPGGDSSQPILDSVPADPELDAAFQVAVERRVLTATERLENELRVTREDKDALDKETARFEAELSAMALELDAFQKEALELRAASAMQEIRFDSLTRELQQERSDNGTLRTELGKAKALLERLSELQAEAEAGREAKGELQKSLAVIDELRSTVASEREISDRLGSELSEEKAKRQPDLSRLADGLETFLGRKK